MPGFKTTSYNHTSHGSRRCTVSFSFYFNLCAFLIFALLLADPLRYSATTAPTVSSNDVAGEEDPAEPEGLPASPPLTSPCLTLHPLDGQCGGDDPAIGLGDQNTFKSLSKTLPVTPIPDIHLQSDNGGPSEPISWAFRHQALGDSFDMDPQSSPLGVFGEDNRSPTPSSPAGIRDDQINPTLLQSSPAMSTPWTDGSQRLVDRELDPTLFQLPAVLTPPTDVNQLLVNPVASTVQPPVTTTHSLTSFTTARSQYVNAFLSGSSLAVAPRTASISTTETLHTPPAASPQRGVASAIILTSLTPAPGSTFTPDIAPPSPFSNPAATAAVATPLNRSATQNVHGHGRGHGRGGRGRRGQGGRMKEKAVGNANNSDTNADADTYLMHPITAASHHRITAINKRVYPPDGTPVAPLGASHSANLDGMYPCVTFQAPPSPAVPKKQSQDVVSKADIISGKRARKGQVRQS